MINEYHTCNVCDRVLWDKSIGLALPRIVLTNHGGMYFAQGNEKKNKDGSSDITTEIIPGNMSDGISKYDRFHICDDNVCILGYFNRARKERDRKWKDK